MKRQSFSCGLALIAVLSSGGTVQAAEVKVLASNSVRTMLADITPLFERASGHKVTLGFGTSSQVAKRMLSGESADLVVITPEEVDQLSKAGKVVAGSRVDIARSLMGVGVRAGTTHPDIGTPEALKRTLLAAKFVTFSDPTTGAASGLHTLKVFELLGIAAEMKPKYRLGDGTTSGRLVVSGEAELAIWQISAMKAVAGLEIVGPLPAELQLTTHLSAGIAANATAPDAAKTLIGFFASPEAAAIIRAKGLEPGSGPS